MPMSCSNRSLMQSNIAAIRCSRRRKLASRMRSLNAPSQDLRPVSTSAAWKWSRIFTTVDIALLRDGCRDQPVPALARQKLYLATQVLDPQDNHAVQLDNG